MKRERREFERKRRGARTQVRQRKCEGKQKERIARQEKERTEREAAEQGLKRPFLDIYWASRRVTTNPLNLISLLLYLCLGSFSRS